MLQDFIGAISLGLIWAVMAIAIYITYKILDIADMTVEGSITMGAAISAVCISNGMNPYLTLLLAFGGGLLAGLVTGFFHTILKIPALLSGILTMLALYSVNLRIMGKANISLLKMDTVFTPFENLGLSKNLAVIAVMVVIVGVIICALYWFFGTELGCAIRATGNNHRMARAQALQRAGRACGGAHCPEPELCGYEHGHWKHRHRIGFPYHRGGAFWEAQFLFAAAFFGIWRRRLPHHHRVCAVARHAQQRFAAVYCADGGACFGAARFSQLFSDA